VSELNDRISAALANGAEFLAMGEIAANTGLLVSQAPRNNPNYDIIVNNIDLSKGCMVKVKHGREQFKVKIKHSNYDFLIFVYSPGKIENGVLKPKHGRATDKERGTDKKRGLYIFPRDIVLSAIEGKSGTSFNPRKIKVNGIQDKKKYKEYRNAYHLILDKVPNSPPDFV